MKSRFESGFARRRETAEEMKELLGRQAKRQTLPLLRSDTFGKVRLEPCMAVDNNTRQVEFRLGVSKMYVLKDIIAFADAMRQNLEVSYGKNFSFLHTMEMFEARSRKMVHFLMEWSSEYEVRMRKEATDQKAFSARLKLRYMPLDAESMERFLKAVGDVPFLANVAGKGEQMWQVTEEHFRPKLFVKGVSDGMEVSLDDVVSLRCVKHYIYFKHNKIFLIPRGKMEEAEEFLECLSRQPMKRAFFQKDDIQPFFRQMLPALQSCMDCRITGLNAFEYSVEPVSFRFYLDMPRHDFVTCLVKAFYGDVSYSVYDVVSDLEYRDLYKEREIAREVSGMCNAFDEQERAMVISGDDELLYTFLTEGIERLGKIGQVYISDSLKKIRILPSPKVAAGISLSGICWNCL